MINYYFCFPLYILLYVSYCRTISVTTITITRNPKTVTIVYLLVEYYFA